MSDTAVAIVIFILLLFAAGRFYWRLQNGLTWEKNKVSIVRHVIIISGLFIGSVMLGVHVFFQ